MLRVQLLIFLFQLLIWHFFVLTQKSTQKKSRQKDVPPSFKRTPAFLSGRALKFQNKIFSKEFSSA